MVTEYYSICTSEHLTPWAAVVAEIYNMYLNTGVHGAVSRTARPIDPPGRKHSKLGRGYRGNDPLGLRWQHMSINVDLEDSMTSIVSGNSLKEHSKIYVGDPRVYLI